MTYSNLLEATMGKNCKGDIGRESVSFDPSLTAKGLTSVDSPYPHEDYRQDPTPGDQTEFDFDDFDDDEGNPPTIGGRWR